MDGSIPGRVQSMVNTILGTRIQLRRWPMCYLRSSSQLVLKGLILMLETSVYTQEWYVLNSVDTLSPA